MSRQSESIIEELEDILNGREYILNLLSELRDSTQTELNKAVQDLKEIISTQETYINNTLRIDSDKIETTIQDEKEVCALSIDEFVEKQRQIKEQSDYPEFDAGFEACMTLLTERAEAIRARTK